MCGIFACLFCDGSTLSTQLKAEILSKLKRRGPDVVKELTISVHSPFLSLNLIGTLLQMRGDPTPQPLPVSLTASTKTAMTNYLLWNANMFGGRIKVPTGGNDTALLAQELSSHEESVSLVLSTLSGVHGPWALVYWQESTKSLWFGRDVFGRRSLLWHMPSEEGGQFILCSVGHYSEREMPLGYWKEVPANGIYQLKCHGPNMESGELICYPWMQDGEMFQSEPSVHEDLASLKTLFKTRIIVNRCLQVPLPKLNKTTPITVHTPQFTLENTLSIDEQATIETTPGSETEEASDYHSTFSQGQCEIRGIEVGEEGKVQKAKKADKVASLAPLPSVTAYPVSSAEWLVLSQQFLKVLQEAVQRRVTHAPKLPSNASSTDQSPPISDSLPISDTLPTFDPALFPQTQEELSEPLPSRKTTAVCVGAHTQVPVDQGCVSMSVNLTGEKLSPDSSECPASEPPLVLKGVESKQRTCLSGREAGMRVGVARVAVLYSGGVDSTVLAALTDRCLEKGEPIDLINVAFEQKSSPPDKRYEVPDRVSAVESLRELNPERQWNLVLVNVTLEEVNNLRSSRISHMVYPLCTVLDDSIGCALWFAARGEGLLYSDHCPPIRYQSQARTLFIGIGADEQLAGYSRHRTKFNSSGWEGLLSELEMDIKRLAKRNLGRDDRCVADHHREGQFPFLDEGVVTFLQGLPVHHKADLILPRGQGEKRLLREVAHLLGCHGASKLPKRAIQFGSRMAKMAGTSSNREQGFNVTDRLLPG